MDTIKMTKDIFCTLGPASMNRRVIQRLTEMGATLFRINLSHTSLEDVEEVIDFIRNHTKVPICLDTEGAQVRTGAFSCGKIKVSENSIVRIVKGETKGSESEFSLYPNGIVNELEVGDLITIDFNAALVQVIQIDQDGVLIRALNGGDIGSNKAVTIERALTMPPLTTKDIKSLEIGKNKGITHVALSFANHPRDVDEIRNYAGKDAFVISKIECRNGVSQLEKIAEKSNGILIDRGDLSREFPVEHIPILQKQIINRTKVVGRKVYVATNLLESMVLAPVPTRAEVNDVFNTLVDGVDGLVLAAETAIGKHPIECAGMIVKLIDSYNSSTSMTPEHYASDPSSLLVEPHGGILVNSEAQDEIKDEFQGAKKIVVSQDVLMDCQQISLGTFSPLKGFMDSKTLESVLDKNQLPDGTVWTLPICLQMESEKIKNVSYGDLLRLVGVDGITYALLDVSEIFPAEVKSLAGRWYGSNSKLHPGVKKLASGGDVFVAGKVILLRKLPTLFPQFELTPAQTRFLFTRKGWSRIVGFHTRNVPHRIHEYIQLSALEKTGADGLYLSPVTGPRKSGDFLPGLVLESYQLMIQLGIYPSGQVSLGAFSSYPRYAGPREAVFTAICRKNMGCSHFIVGRDHTGVGDFYNPDASRALFESIGDIGIEPVFFNEMTFDTKKENYILAGSSQDLKISGTEARLAIKKGQKLPEWFMRDEVQKFLHSEVSSGRKVFSD